MAKYLMALDQGTTSSRCILFEKNGKIHSMAQKEFSQIYPQPGWVEHDPREIWASQLAVTTEAMAKVMAQPEDIAAIGITNQRETTIIWDRTSGEPIYNAIVWQCRRPAARIDELVALGYRDLRKDRTYPRCIFQCNEDCMDPGSCGRSQRACRTWRTAVWNRGQLADI